jgi:hypothetical protein
MKTEELMSRTRSNKKDIREGTPSDAKAEASQRFLFFASLGVPSRIVLGFGRNRIGTWADGSVAAIG